ncbi:WD40-repeat-containing domain protein [Lanmaoa asiatica]|nr:WD40-repeat-containing domain protein [Lanmaoa asiatica]
MSPGMAVGHRSKVHATPTKLLRGHYGSMMFVAFISHDQIISASDEDKTIRRWSFPDGDNKVLKGPVVCALATSPNRRWLAMGGNDGRIRLLDPGTPTEVMKSVGKHTDVIKSLSFSPDSSQLASGAQDGTMIVWSSTTLEPVAGPFKGHADSVWWVCYSPDGKKIASCDRETIQIWDSSAWASVAINEQAWSLAWSSDGHILFAGCIDGRIKIYNIGTGVLHATCDGHSDVVFSITFSHSAKFFATASWDKTVRLWEAMTFQQIGPCLQHDTKIHSISISPDDNYLVSGSRDSIIRVWNLRTVAPNLFKDFPLEPNRGPTNAPFSLFSRLPIPTKDPGPSNVSPPNGSYKTDPVNVHFYRCVWLILIFFFEHNETPDGSDRTSIKSRISKKGSILKIFRGRDDPIDDPTPSPPSIGIHPPSSNSSFPHHPEDPSIVPSLSSLTQDTDKALAPAQSKSIQETKGTNPVAGGSHGDIYRGMLNVNGRAMRVAVKVIKRYTAQGDDKSKQRRLRREIKLWLTLDHRNIIPLLGTTRYYGDFLSMVCPWVENGNLTSYLDRRNNDLTGQMRLGIINDVALGLQYLHSQNVVHGDISGANILIYGSGRACIADFGLSIVVTEIDGSSIARTYQIKGTLRWTAPELIDIDTPESEDENAPKIFPTVQSDMYSFGGIMLQALSGKIPYHYFTRDEQVIVAISKKERPRRPSSTSAVTDDQWRFMMECWSFVVTDRPSDSDTVEFVHEQLLNVVAASCESTLQIRSPTVRDSDEYQQGR